MLDWTELALGSVALLCLYGFCFRDHSLDHIPTVGYSNSFLSVISSVKYIFWPREILLEGYKRFPNGIFKFSTFDGWSVVVNGTKHVDDIRRASHDQVHAMTLTANYLGFKYTLGRRLLENPFHIDVIRNVLTRNIGSRYQDIHDEVKRAYADAISCNGQDWITVTTYKLQVDVITRVSSRFFFGEPLCNDAAFRDICEKATMEIFKGRFIRVFPAFTRPFATRIVTDIHGLRAKMENYLRPIVEHRLEQRAVHGPNWPDKPNDLISWLIDAAITSGEEVTVEDLSIRILFINFGAIHTSSSTFTSALYQIALDPKAVKEIREEVESVVSAEGWSKASIGKMHELDSYLRESQRLHFMGLVTSGRLFLKDFTFSDGTTMPKDSAISINSYARHIDENIYPNPQHFDGSRFVPKDGSAACQLLVATPTLEYHSFGHGREACPGRFFAITELKTMMAHLVTNYDIKLQTDEYPQKTFVEVNSIPNMSAKVMFRKRRSFS